MDDFFENVDAAFGWFLPPRLGDCPLWARRAFVLTLPVSLPVYVLWWVVWAAWVCLLAVLALAARLAACVLLPIAWCVVWAFVTLVGLWAKDNSHG